MRRARQGSATESALRAIRHIIENIVANPDHAFISKHHLRGNLAGILRVKTGRLRLFFIAKRTEGAAIVLFIGYRKEGDKRDAYTEFLRLLNRSAFDAQFAELGLAKPQIK
jgi:hypothetical protein